MKKMQLKTNKVFILSLVCLLILKFTQCYIYKKTEIAVIVVCVPSRVVFVVIISFWAHHPLKAPSDLTNISRSSHSLESSVLLCVFCVSFLYFMMRLAYGWSMFLFSLSYFHHTNYMINLFVWSFCWRTISILDQSDLLGWRGTRAHQVKCLFDFILRGNR